MAANFVPMCQITVSPYMFNQSTKALLNYVEYIEEQKFALCFSFSKKRNIRRNDFLSGHHFVR
jgi:hypothetical protein